MAVGIPNDLFWSLTVHEVSAVLEQRVTQTRSADLRAGLIAATILNVHRRKGARLVKPSDFLAKPRVQLTSEEAEAFLDKWAATIDRRVRKEN